MSFKEYVVKRRVTNTPAGDFVADAKKAGGLENVNTLQELDTYLIMRGACGDAIIAGRSVWRGYCAAKRRAEIVT